MALARKIARKYRTTIVETSPENSQIWIFTGNPISPEQRGRIQKEIAARIGADASSADGYHFGRVPGFKNGKPNRKCWVNFHGVSSAPTLDVSSFLAAIETTATPGSQLSLPKGAGPMVAFSGSATRSAARCEVIESDPGPRIFGWAVNAFRRGTPKAAIEAKVLEEALACGKTGVKKFVERTVVNAENAAHNNLF